jgi:hypothetical protein
MRTCDICGNEFDEKLLPEGISGDLVLNGSFFYGDKNAYNVERDFEDVCGNCMQRIEDLIVDLKIGQ